MGERGDKGARYADGKPLWSISGAPLFFQCAQNEATAQATAVRHRRHRRRCEVTSRALLVRLEAKPGMEAAVEDFLFSARKLVTQEAGTRAWFALRFGRSQYGIFDAFDDDAGRNAHLDGAVAAALHSQGSELFARAPTIERVEVLADKLPTASPAPPDTKGLLLTFPAKTGHAAQADQFVRDAQPWVRDEQKTTSWFGLRMENGDYGIFDVFPDNGGRFSHLTGHVPRELATHALSLLGGMPDITLLDVLAEHFKFPLGSVTGDPGSG